ncbi:MAG: MarR family transcriptional regulator [Bacteroidia bacterium]
MGIENDIKQRKFKSEHQKAGINLMFTVREMEHKHFQILKKFGVTPPQFNILRILRGQYPKATTVNDLIDRMIDKASNASRIVEKLRAKAMVERKTSELDRRAVDVAITQKGLELLRQIDVIEQEFYFGLEFLTVEEANQLNALLDKGRGSEIK